MKDLTVTEYKNIRVLTTAQLAEAYGTDSKKISYNFSHNKERYIEGKHYIVLEGKAKKDFINHREFHDSYKKASKLYLWTQNGALLHAKSLNTDEAWEVYQRLVDNYFNVRTESPALSDEDIMSKALLIAQRNVASLEQQVIEMKPKVEFCDTVAASKDSITIGQLAKILSKMGYPTGEKRLFNDLRQTGYLIKQQGKNHNMPTQKAMDRGLFEVVEKTYTKSDGEVGLSATTYVTTKGQLFFCDKITKWKEKQSN